MGRPQTTKPGDRFGNWTTVEIVERRARGGGKYNVYWLCECECGVRCVLARDNLRTDSACTGHPQLEADARRAERERKAAERAEKRAAMDVTRELAAKALAAKRAEREVSKQARATRAVRSWREMMHRCYMPNHQDFPNYGGRGIRVDERWHSFENFLADMGERPRGMTLDRRDNDGNYEPGNCRWATATEQNRNSRHCKLTVADVVEVRAQLAAGARIGALAARYGMTPANVYAIRTQKSWRDVA